MTAPSSICSKWLVPDCQCLWSGPLWSCLWFSCVLASDRHWALCPLLCFFTVFFDNMHFTVKFQKWGMLTLILLFMTTPTFANSVDPDQMASEEAIWSGSTLSFSLWICTKTLYDVIWLADSQKWVWLIKLFNRIRVNWTYICNLELHQN